MSSATEEKKKQPESTEKSAADRLKEAFLRQLAESELKPVDLELLARISEMLDDHFKYYCSFYDPKETVKKLFRQDLDFSIFIPNPSGIDRISVASLTKEAGINRTTFYKTYPNVKALYDACCEDLIAKFLAIPIPDEKTPQTMLAYGTALYRTLRENVNVLNLLTHRANNRTLPYVIAYRLKNAMAASLSTMERASFRVQENLDVFPELFSVWNSFFVLDQLFPDLFADQNLPEYHPEHSLLENLAFYFAERYGGTFPPYYAFGLAALKLLASKRYDGISVSELCEAAGYPRSTFYVHFADAADYTMKVCENLVVMCVSAFLYFLDHPDELTGDAMRVFRGEMAEFKTEGIRAIFLNGSIAYILPMIFIYLLRRFMKQTESHVDDAVNKSRTTLISYYLAYSMRLFSMYYIDDMTDAELQIKQKEIMHLKKLLGENDGAEKA